MQSETEFRIWSRREGHATVMREICEARGVTLDLVLSRSRKRELFLVRREIGLALTARGVSYPKIARLLNRHHTTLMNCVGKIDKKVRVPRDPLPPMNCAACGTVFAPRNLRARTCSKACHRERDRQQKVAWRRRDRQRQRHDHAHQGEANQCQTA